jgi:hypothetical protein
MSGQLKTNDPPVDVGFQQAAILLATAAQHLAKMRLARNKNRERNCGY